MPYLPTRPALLIEFGNLANTSPDYNADMPGAVQNQGERLGPREAVAPGALIWVGTGTYASYWANIFPLLLPGAGYTHKASNATNSYLYTNERWNLYLPPAPAP